MACSDLTGRFEHLGGLALEGAEGRLASFVDVAVRKEVPKEVVIAIGAGLASTKVNTRLAARWSRVAARVLIPRQAGPRVPR